MLSVAEDTALLAPSLMNAGGLTVVEDALDTYSAPLFSHYVERWWLCRTCADARPIVVVTFATALEQLHSLFQRTSEHCLPRPVHIIDCYSDPLGWGTRRSRLEGIYTQLQEANVNVVECQEAFSLETLVRTVREVVGDAVSARIAFDDLTMLCTRHSPAEMGLFLLQLERLGNHQVLLGGVHCDVVSEGHRTELERVADTVVEVKDPMTTLAQVEGGRAVLAASKRSQVNDRCIVVWHKRQSGRVARAVSQYRVEGDGRLRRIALPSSLQSIATVSAAADRQGRTPSVGAGAAASGGGGREDADPDMPFKMHLTAEEERARQEVLLPFHRAIRPDGADSGRGTIYFELDDAEDYDDEDPDDDLDI